MTFGNNSSGGEHTTGAPAAPATVGTEQSNEEMSSESQEFGSSSMAAQREGSETERFR